MLYMYVCMCGCLTLPCLAFLTDSRKLDANEQLVCMSIYDMI